MCLCTCSPAARWSTTSSTCRSKPLLASARAAGLTAVDGLGMLLWQAVPGFERWFGVTVDDADVEAARAAILADLARD